MDLVAFLDFPWDLVAFAFQRFEATALVIPSAVCCLTKVYSDVVIPMVSSGVTASAFVGTAWSLLASAVIALVPAFLAFEVTASEGNVTESVACSAAAFDRQLQMEMMRQQRKA